MDAPFSKIVEALIEVVALARVEEKRTRQEHVAAKAGLQQGEMALKVLTGVSVDSFAPKSPSETLCAKKADLIPIIEELLTANGPLAVEDLQGLTADRLRTMQLSASGISRTFTAALKDRRFQTDESDGLVSLRSDAARVA